MIELEQQTIPAWSLVDEAKAMVYELVAQGVYLQHRTTIRARLQVRLRALGKKSKLIMADVDKAMKQLVQDGYATPWPDEDDRFRRRGDTYTPGWTLLVPKRF